MVSRNMLRMIVKEFPTLKITKAGLGIATKDGNVITIGDKFYFRRNKESWRKHPFVPGAISEYTLENFRFNRDTVFNFTSGKQLDKWTVDVRVKTVIDKSNDRDGIVFHIPDHKDGKYSSGRYGMSWFSTDYSSQEELTLVGLGGMSGSDGDFFSTLENAMSIYLEDGVLAKIGDEVWMWRNTVPYPALVCKKIVDIVWKQDKLIPICAYDGTNYARKETAPLFSTAESACNFCPERATNTEHAFIRTGIIRGKREAA